MDKVKLLLGFSSKLLQLAQKGQETEQSLAAVRDCQVEPGDTSDTSCSSYQYPHAAILRNFAFDQGACGVKPYVFYFVFRS